jgi:TolA-binding protein
VTTLDLHPEEMLDAARRGTLGARGEADLRAHLRRCVACRLSLSLPDDLRVEAAATTADGALLSQMVRGALLDEPRAAGDHRAFRARGGLTLRRAALGLALLLVGGNAGAAVWAGRESLARTFAPVIIQLRHSRGDTATPATRDLGRAHRTGPSQGRPDEAPVAAAPVIVEVAPAVVEVAPALAPPVAVASAPARSVHARVEARAAATNDSADALFAEANGARRAGDYSLALRRYAELRRAHPGTREELTARVVVGDLMLAEGSAREALASFDSYLAASPEGTLAEEALVGRALALKHLGRRDEERDAWSQLLRKHPHSVQGARARSRLAELR